MSLTAGENRRQVGTALCLRAPAKSGLLPPSTLHGPMRYTSTMLHDDNGRCKFEDLSYVESLPYRGHHYWFVLEKCRHIGVQKLRPDHICWTARVLTKEKRYHQKTIGHLTGKDALTYEQAITKAREWFRTSKMLQLASPSSPIGTMKYLMICPIGDTYTVGHALRDYIEWRKIAATPKGYYNTLCLINYHLIPLLAFVPLEDFTGNDLKRLALKVLETPPKKGTQFPEPSIDISELSADDVRKRKATLNTLIGILRMAFRMAWENGHINSERAWRCLRRIPVAQKSRTIFLSRDECRDLLAQCRPPLRRLVLGALYSGCRVGELGNLRVQDVGRQGFGIFVDAFKRGPSRFVFLPDEGMSFFLRLCEGRPGHDYVFVSDKGTKWTTQYKNQFKKAVVAAGLPQAFVFHGLRHTYASQLVAAGVTLEIIARQLGHANTTTVSRFYGHLTEHLRESVVRQHFASLLPSLSKLERERLKDIDAISARQHWRSYAAIEQHTSLPRKVRTIANAEVMDLFTDLE